MQHQSDNNQSPHLAVLHVCSFWAWNNIKQRENPRKINSTECMDWYTIQLYQLLWSSVIKAKQNTTAFGCVAYNTWTLVRSGFSALMVLCLSSHLNRNSTKCLTHTRTNSARVQAWPVKVESDSTWKITGQEAPPSTTSSYTHATSIMLIFTASNFCPRSVDKSNTCTLLSKRAWTKLTLLYCNGCVNAVYSADHTHTHPFNSPLSGTTQVSRYQKGKTNLDFTEAKRQWVAVASAGRYASMHLAPDT